jgi:hypothetical protein
MGESAPRRAWNIGEFLQGDEHGSEALPDGLDMTAMSARSKPASSTRKSECMLALNCVAGIVVANKPIHPAQRQDGSGKGKELSRLAPR